MSKCTAVGLLLTLWVVCLVGPAAAGEPWRLCDRTPPLMNVTAVKIVPFPIVHGAPATFTLYATHDATIDSGRATSSVRIFGIRVFSRAGNLGETVPLPLHPGVSTLAFPANMPHFMPPARMVLRLDAAGGDGAHLFCVDIDLKSRPPRPPRPGSPLLTPASSH